MIRLFVSRLSMLLSGALLSAIAMSSPGEVVAQDAPIARQRVYVVAAAVEPELEDEAARAAAAARAALRRVNGADWQAADQRFLGYDDNTLQRLVQARHALDEGRTAYVDLRLDEAIQHLESAVSNFDSSMSALEDPSDLGNALLFLGAAQQFNGQARDARRTFQRLHVQMPHIVPDPNEFSPDVVESYNAAAPRRTDGTITVESEPNGAVAYVDFIPRGLTPLSVDGLARGQHSVRVAAPGMTPYIENADVGRSAAEVNAYLMALDDTEGLQGLVQGITGHELEVGDGAIAEVAAMLELDKIGVIRVSYGDSSDTVKLELVMFDTASQRRVLRGEVQAPRGFGELEAVVSRSIEAGIVSVLNPQEASDDERIPAQTEIVNEDPDATVPGDETLIQKWWFWTAVIGGALVAGAVIAIAVTQSGGDDLGQDSDGHIVFEF